MKSLIKPPPPRSSWELLLDDYLKDPNFQVNLAPHLPDDDSPSHLKAPYYPWSQVNALDPSQSTAFVLPSHYQYPLYSSYNPYEVKYSYLPPRRYQINLDELVYLISQIGRADLYRELVQYAKAQQIIYSSPHLYNQPSNVNAYSQKSAKKQSGRIKHK